MPNESNVPLLEGKRVQYGKLCNECSVYFARIQDIHL